ncbi:hypothetical protein [Citrobacter portucalensis]|uniref:hypothetical protein n=1 Tax=Citrobacter portucalensis TaxID=1639133 RepID=UPI001F36D6EC|nr:hypothetical protein [Citrobacter portucalensis]HEE0502756.1 hypothetical protein [Klebsiella pneumoniae]
MIITLSEQIILTANQPRSGTHHFSARASVQTSDSVDAVEGRFVPRADLINIKVKWSTKTGHRVRVFPVSVF